MGGLHAKLLKTYWEVRKNKTGDRRDSCAQYSSYFQTPKSPPPPPPLDTHRHIYTDKKKHTNMHTHLPSMDKGWIKVYQKRKPEIEA